MAEALEDDYVMYESLKDGGGERRAPGQVYVGGGPDTVTGRVNAWNPEDRYRDLQHFVNREAVNLEPTVSMMPKEFKPDEFEPDEFNREALLHLGRKAAGQHFHFQVFNHLVANDKYKMDQEKNPFLELEGQITAILPGRPQGSASDHDLEMSVKGYGIVGRIDCVLNFSDLSSRIIDFKWTRSDNPMFPKLGLQLLLYQWLFGKTKGKAGAEMYLIRYNENANTLTRYQFKPPDNCQYSADRKSPEDFESAIKRYKRLFE